MKIENTDVKQQIIKGLTLSPGATDIPDSVNQKVRVVYVANPPKHLNVVATLAATSTVPNTVYTTPSDKDFFLTNAFFLLATNEAVGPATGTMTATLFSGESVNIFSMAQWDNLPAGGHTTNSLTEYYNPPIKLERGSTITVDSSGAAESRRVAASIKGYTEEII
jgi:hypothetical protein